MTLEVTCVRCGAVARSINGWWLRVIETHEWLCPTCAAIVTSDDGDHGDEHVESAEISAALHASRIEHQARSCRACLREGVPLRPDVRWTGTR